MGNAETMKQRKIRSVIFDFDGLMVDSERVSERAWDRVAKEYGIVIDNRYYSRVRGMNNEGARSIFREMFGDKLSYDEVKAKKHEYFAEDLEKNGLDKKKGLDELLDYIDENKISKAIASGSTVTYVRDCSARAGIMSDFDIIIGGDMVKKCKPDPEVFEMAANQLGSEPEACLVLEDSMNGAKAALNGGFQIIIVPDSVEPPAELIQQVNGVFDNLIDVIGYIRQQNRS